MMGSMKMFNLMVMISSLCISLIHTAVSHGVLIDTKGASKDEDPFIPTKEWQFVKEGQKIPPGLHVRYNLQTGIVEAKLLEKDANKDKDSIPLVVKKGEKVPLGITKKGVTRAPEEKHEPVLSTETKTQLTREQIMEALKNVNHQDDVKDKKIIEEAKEAKFRTYDELKKDFEKINVKVKTDVEIIKELVTKINNTNSSNDEKIVALTDLEYYLHQIDNAIDFMKMDGLNLLLDEMNSKEWRLRSEATFAIGSALQSNVKVQIRALQIGLLQNLKLKIIGEKEKSCLNRALYTLSTLLRNFPYAQLRFVKDGGLGAMKELFVDQLRGTSRLQVRMITLLHDLVTERISHESNVNRSDPMQIEKLRQYQQVNIAHHIVKYGWCELTQQLLRLSDHDSREKVLISLTTFHKFCPTSSPQSREQLLGLLQPLATEYRVLAEEERKEGEQNGLFNSILQHIVDLINKVLTRPNDEL